MRGSRVVGSEGGVVIETIFDPWADTSNLRCGGTHNRTRTDQSSLGCSIWARVRRRGSPPARSKYPHNDILRPRKGLQIGECHPAKGKIECCRAVPTPGFFSSITRSRRCSVCSEILSPQICKSQTLDDLHKVASCRADFHSKLVSWQISTITEFDAYRDSKAPFYKAMSWHIKPRPNKTIRR